MSLSLNTSDLSLEHLKNAGKRNHAPVIILVDNRKSA
eukprot:COSAG02_NODE_68211_length_251_cov_0.677632_2_plen_36_part_01